MELSQSILSNSLSMVTSFSNHDILSKKEQITCDKCNLIPKIIKITDDDKIIIKCQNKLHGRREVSINEYLNKISKYNSNYYKCDICQKRIQKYCYPIKSFKYCYDCKIIICNKCIKNHKNSHNIISNEEYNIKCSKHYNEKYVYYCFLCDKNLCSKCLNDDNIKHFESFIKLSESK